MEKPNIPEEDVTLFIAILVILFFAIVAVYFKVILPFVYERNYIKMELKRVESEQEYYYWKRELNKIYLKYLIPFGRFFV